MEAEGINAVGRVGGVSMPWGCLEVSVDRLRQSEKSWSEAETERQRRIPSSPMIYSRS